MESQTDYTENLHVASFSAYLNSTDDNSFLLKLTGAIPDPISPEVTPRLKSTFVRSKTAEEGEIGVFSADKYFNMKMDYYQAPKPLIDHNSQTTDVKQEKPKLSAGTPSVTSDASCNSQTALLPTSTENPPRIKPKKRLGKSCFTGFGCNGPCLDKKSVRINQGVEYGIVRRRDVGKDSFRFANPVVFDGTKDSSQSGLIQVPDSVIIENFSLGKHLEEARKSIEVFGSQKVTKKKCDIATNLERKLAMLTWDAIPKSENIASTWGSGAGPIDDVQSDASSDLFEIETGHMLLTMQPQAPDQISTYEPSEASIEWSVVTASAADYDQKMSIGGDMRVAKTKNVVKKEGQKGRNGAGLLGCKSQKAVSIDETAVRANAINAKSMALRKPQSYSERKGFEFATGRRSLSSRTISP